MCILPVDKPPESDIACCISTGMITLNNNKVTLTSSGPRECVEALSREQSPQGSISSQILDAHNRSASKDDLRVVFDSLISHDITYVGIIQTARASGLKSFPVPYTLTNCHNSLCAVGGTINEDDHVFGLSAARRYGGDYVPANLAVIHQYAREMVARSGGMVLGSDSHTRYGPLGTMGIGEGGPELVKQLLSNTYDIKRPEVVLVYLTGEPRRGVGPHDVAIALCGAVYGNNFVKNKITEFAGPGIAKLPMDFRFGIDVMTTETACLSSVWETDDVVRAYFEDHGRPGDFKLIRAKDGARYDGLITIDLSKIEPAIALPFHPSRAFTIREFNENAADLLRDVEKEAERSGMGSSLKLTDKLRSGRLLCDQGVIAGCAGGMTDNIREAAAILSRASAGQGYFSLSIYPSSMPVHAALIEDGSAASLMDAGVLFKSAFCGPCFGAGDVPPHGGFSIRHTTRNFPAREGSRPGDGQCAVTALMDARSIAATARAGGVLTAATEADYEVPAARPRAKARLGAYEKRVYRGAGKPLPEEPLRYGPNIADWPAIEPLRENLLLEFASVIYDPVTTTDELIPSGETSSYRSNPLKLASFTLSRRDPLYTGRARAVCGLSGEKAAAFLAASGIEAPGEDSLSIGSAIFARRPGDGSAREQAASCQRVLGGAANIAEEYATKRYRSNLINWGLLPFTVKEGFRAEPGDRIYVPGLRSKLLAGEIEYPSFLIASGKKSAVTLFTGALTDEERAIILSGCLMNYYAGK